MKIFLLIAVGVAALSLSACAEKMSQNGAAPANTSDKASNSALAARETSSTTQQSQFFANLSKRCGQAFAGALISDAAADPDMAGKPMVMHIRRCTSERIEIPFHIGGQTGGDGWDRSRTWIISKTDDGLRLKHNHRKADGSADPVTRYGGDTDDEGSITRQEFAVDEASIAMFKKNGLTASLTNIWFVELTDEGFSYGLSRADRDFRVSFDFTKPIAPPPPAPWGW